MANPTTNYGFILPAPTDLVTDLPADFDIALQGVDTRLKALQPGTTAGDLAYASSTANTNVRLGIGSTNQVLGVAAGVPAWIASPSGTTFVARTSFTNVATQAFDAVFTSTYKSYLVVIEKLESVTLAADALHLQLRVSGVTTATGYYANSISASVSGTGAANTPSNNTAQAIVCTAIGSTQIRNGGFFYISNVGDGSEQSSINGHYMNGAAGRMAVFGSSNSNSAIYTGFLLKAATTNITGTVAIYGLAAA